MSKLTPSAFFQDLKPISQMSVKHALEALAAGVPGMLVIHLMPNGRIEHRFVSGQASIQLDLWRGVKPPPGEKNLN